jgi:predicted nucleotidyltransferase
LNTELINIIVSHILDSVRDVKLIYLFGSEAENKTHINSDIDIAILNSSALNNLELYQLKTAIEVQIQRDIDLIDFHKASIILKKEIVSTGKIIYTSLDVSEINTFESRIIEDYIDFKELVKPIEDKIRKRGAIY